MYGENSIADLAFVYNKHSKYLLFLPDLTPFPPENRSPIPPHHKGYWGWARPLGDNLFRVDTIKSPGGVTVTACSRTISLAVTLRP